MFFGSFISLQNNLEFSRELNSFFARACAKILSFGSFQFEMMLLSKTPLHNVWNSLKISQFTTLITLYFQSKSIWRIHNMSRFFFCHWDNFGDFQTLQDEKVFSSHLLFKGWANVNLLKFGSWNISSKNTSCLRKFYFSNCSTNSSGHFPWDHRHSSSFSPFRQIQFNFSK